MNRERERNKHYEMLECACSIDADSMVLVLISIPFLEMLSQMELAPVMPLPAAINRQSRPDDIYPTIRDACFTTRIAAHVYHSSLLLSSSIVHSISPLFCSESIIIYGGPLRILKRQFTGCRSRHARFDAQDSCPSPL